MLQPGSRVSKGRQAFVAPVMQMKATHGDPVSKSDVQSMCHARCRVSLRDKNLHLPGQVGVVKHQGLCQRGAAPALAQKRFLSDQADGVSRRIEQAGEVIEHLKRLKVTEHRVECDTGFAAFKPLEGAEGNAHLIGKLPASQATAKAGSSDVGA